MRAPSHYHNIRDIFSMQTNGYHIFVIVIVVVIATIAAVAAAIPLIALSYYTLLSFIIYLLIYFSHRKFAHTRTIQNRTRNKQGYHSQQNVCSSIRVCFSSAMFMRHKSHALATARAHFGLLFSSVVTVFFYSMKPAKPYGFIRA